MTSIRIARAGSLATLQDTGRPGLLTAGVSASGPMDRSAFERAGDWLGGAGTTGIEFSGSFGFWVEGGTLAMATDGGMFTLAVNGEAGVWPARVDLKSGDKVDIRPGSAGTWGYVRFSREVVDLPVLGSRSTNSIAGLGRVLSDGDVIEFADTASFRTASPATQVVPASGPIRVIWGLHAETFSHAVRDKFVGAQFAISAQMNRMGIRLIDRAGVFRDQRALSLVSDAIVPGDIQILGDGTPIVLMRDHQPTGGYPRIATVVSADLDRFAQLRPGSEVRFEPVTLKRARELKP